MIDLGYSAEEMAERKREAMDIRSAAERARDEAREQLRERINLCVRSGAKFHVLVQNSPAWTCVGCGATIDDIHFLASDNKARVVRRA